MCGRECDQNIGCSLPGIRIVSAEPGGENKIRTVVDHEELYPQLAHLVQDGGAHPLGVQLLHAFMVAYQVHRIERTKLDQHCVFTASETNEQQKSGRLRGRPVVLSLLDNKCKCEIEPTKVQIV